jgi:hypothetical protein
VTSLFCRTDCRAKRNPPQASPVKVTSDSEPRTVKCRDLPRLLDVLIKGGARALIVKAVRLDTRRTTGSDYRIAADECVTQSHY